jgi:hypothetical protein
MGDRPLEPRVALSTFGAMDPVATTALVRRSGHLGAPAAHALKAAASPTVGRWSWLANTCWYVPSSNLSAVLYNSTTGTLAPVSDQTVFHITGYRAGYFWGKTVTQLGSSPASSTSMIGSVTPQGRVLLTFTHTSSTSSPSVTEGFGTMVRKHRQWTMENQMFTAPSQTLQIGHWAYMLQTHPGLPSWSSLPSAGVSVPHFLSESGATAPQPVIS